MKPTRNYFNNKRNILLIFVTFILLSVESFFVPPAQAFKLKVPKNPLKIPLKIDATIDFRNETDEQIYVVMDNNREAHPIAPGGRTTFSKANVGDSPTFRVYSTSQKKAVRYSRKIGSIGLKSSLGWNGKTF